MGWGAEDLGGGPGLDDPAEIHDDHSVSEDANDAEVMRGEQVGVTELVLQVSEQVDDLAAHRKIE